MANNETSTPINANPALSKEAQIYLGEAGKWAGFLGVLSIIIGIFLFLSAIFANVILPALPGMFPGYNEFSPAVLAVICVVTVLFDILYFFFALYLFRFGRRVKKGINFNDPDQLTLAMGSLRSFFKLWGIVTIVILSLFALEVIFLVVENAGLAAMQHK